MKKMMVLVLGVVSIALMTGCQKKEVAEAPVSQPMVSEQSVVSAATTAMTATVATEPISAAETPLTAATAAVTDAAGAAMEQIASTIEKPTAEQIQQALKNAGLYTGKVDGSLGPKTKKAIEEFQVQNGLNADGKVGPKTWAKLGSHLGSGAAESIATEPIMPTDTSATGTTSN